MPAKFHEDLVRGFHGIAISFEKKISPKWLFILGLVTNTLLLAKPDCVGIGIKIRYRNWIDTRPWTHEVN